MFACSHKRTDVIKLLLNVQSEKIDSNAKKSNGKNAFMLACKDGNLKGNKVARVIRVIRVSVTMVMRGRRVRRTCGMTRETNRFLQPQKLTGVKHEKGFI